MTIGDLIKKLAKHDFQEQVFVKITDDHGTSILPIDCIDKNSDGVYIEIDT